MIRKQKKTKVPNVLLADQQGFNNHNSYVSPTGGKRGYKNYYQNPQKNIRNRRFSIRDSSSSSASLESESEESDSDDEDSDSSLTVVSENDEVEASRRGSDILMESADDWESSDTENKKYMPKKSKGGNAKKTVPLKRAPKKTVSWKNTGAAKKNIRGKDSSLVSGFEGNSSDSDDEQRDILEGIQSAKTTKTTLKSDSDVNDSDSEEAGSEQEYSSSDDSDVDFVKLQAERKAKALELARAYKGISRKEAIANGEEKHDDVMNKDNNTIKGKRRDSRARSFTKFGRRKSEVPLPVDINFTFDFDLENKIDENALFDDSETEVPETGFFNDVGDEDIGEEVTFPENALDDDVSTGGFALGDKDSFLNSHSIQVPKIGENEINSDDDYEIDDNELLATLQADNDLEQFQAPPFEDVSNHDRKNSSVSMEEGDDDNDPFLREEEKFLVNEFEMNGFDDDDAYLEEGTAINAPVADEEAKSLNKFQDEKDTQNKRYDDSSSDFEEDQFDADIDDEDRDNLSDIGLPIFDEEDTDYRNLFTRLPEKEKNKKRIYRREDSNENSEEDDDSYLWNYFFSSDNSSDSDLEEDYKDDKAAMVIFPGKEKNVSEPSQSGEFYNDISSDNDADSGESTDVDLSVPQQTNKKFGSKGAKEVLSSKTADYRPPVLGTWVTIDSKPFGIIDGLSTRTLNSNSQEPRYRPTDTYLDFHEKESSSSIDSDDPALGLDELLNVSELDTNDENDIRIWRDFNNSKRRVPLGAFRNKSVLYNATAHPSTIAYPTKSSFNPTSESNNEFNRRRYSLSNHKYASRRQASNKTSAHSIKKQPRDGKKPPKSNISSKLVRRRASIAEALSEGFRPTKSGLFSENALADVEEILGDDNDIMTLIKGL